MYPISKGLHYALCAVLTTCSALLHVCCIDHMLCIIARVLYWPHALHYCTCALLTTCSALLHVCCIDHMLCIIACVLYWPHALHYCTCALLTTCSALLHLCCIDHMLCIIARVLYWPHALIEISSFFLHYQILIYKLQFSWICSIDASIVTSDYSWFTEKLATKKSIQ